LRGEYRKLPNYAKSPNKAFKSSEIIENPTKNVSETPDDEYSIASTRRSIRKLSTAELKKSIPEKKLQGIPLYLQF